MPRPIYIICVESCVEDKGNVITLFRVMEKLDIARLDAMSGTNLAAQHKPFSFNLVAVWMREDGEPNGPFDYEFRMRVGNSYLVQEDDSSKGQFTFGSNSKLHRFIVKGEIGNFPSFGILEMECRVKPAAGDDGSWITQSYPVFLIDKTPISSTAPAPPSSPPL